MPRRRDWFAAQWNRVMRRLWSVAKLPGHLLTMDIAGLVVVGVLLVLAAIPWGVAPPVVNVVLLLCAAGALWYHQEKFKSTSEFSDEIRSTAPGPPIPTAPEIVALAKAEDYVDDHYDPEAIDYFRRALTELPDYLSRVDEVMEVDGRRAMLRTELVFRGLSNHMDCTSLTNDVTADNPKPSPGSTENVMPKGPTPTVLVPLVAAKKGRLFDAFSAFDSSGASITTLPQSMVRGLLAVVLRMFFDEAMRSTTGEGGLGDLSPSDYTAQRHRWLGLVKDTVGAVPPPGQRQIDFAQAVRAIESLTGDFTDENHATLRLRKLCRSFIENYIIVVEVSRPAGDNLKLAYSHVVEFKRQISSKKDKSFPGDRLAYLRAKHGLMPLTLDAAMTWPLQADSYHFELSAPEGTYVYDHHLEELKSNTVLRQEQFVINDAQQYVRLYCEEARSRAHLYIRRHLNDLRDTGRSGGEMPDLKSVIQLREVPPGGTGNAFTVAALTALIIAYFAIFRVGLDPTLDQASGPHPANSGPQDIPAVILTLPAFLAAAIGRGMDSTSLSRISLRTFYCLWTVALLSVLAVLLYIYNAARNPFIVVSVSLFGHHGSYDMAWVALAAASICVAAYLRREKRAERFYYLQLIHRVAIDDSTNGQYNGEVK